ncbi:hypothetical protein BGZ65_005508, partial [Modicella reniformis]
PGAAAFEGYDSQRFHRLDAQIKRSKSLRDMMGGKILALHQRSIPSMKFTLETIRGMEDQNIHIGVIHNAIVYEVRHAKNWNNAYTILKEYVPPLANAVQRAAENPNNAPKKRITLLDARRHDSNPLTMRPTDEDLRLARRSIATLVRFAPSVSESRTVFMYLLKLKPPLRDDKTINHCLGSLIFQYNTERNPEVRKLGVDFVQVALQRGMGAPGYDAATGFNKPARNTHETFLASGRRGQPQFNQAQRVDASRIQRERETSGRPTSLQSSQQHQTERHLMSPVQPSQGQPAPSNRKVMNENHHVGKCNLVDSAQTSTDHPAVSTDDGCDDQSARHSSVSGQPPTTGAYRGGSNNTSCNSAGGSRSRLREIAFVPASNNEMIYQALSGLSLNAKESALNKEPGSSTTIEMTAALSASV